jgi:hypothetical protein
MLISAVAIELANKQKKIYFLVLLEKNWIWSWWIVSKLGKNNQPRNYNHSSPVPPHSSLLPRRQMPLADGGTNKVSAAKTFLSSMLSYALILSY